MNKTTLSDVLSYEAGLEEGKRISERDRKRLDWVSKNFGKIVKVYWKSYKFAISMDQTVIWAKTLRVLADKAMKHEVKK